ncbi:hypothetical protein SMICM304S_06840 [Streptomyces microflavus]
MVGAVPGRPKGAQRGGAEPTPYTAQAPSGGVSTAAGTAIAAMPKPISASPRAVLRSCGVPVRVRSRQ